MRNNCESENNLKVGDIEIRKKCLIDKEGFRKVKCLAMSYIYIISYALLGRGSALRTG